MGTSSRRWRGASTPSSRRSYGTWGARNIISTHRLRHKESCLENHHYERFERLLQIHNITTSLDRVKFLGKRMILATDMKQHDRIMSEIREKISKGDDLLEDDASVALLLGLILKCADISNQARPRHIAAKWNDRVYQEFYREGDQDRKRGRQVLNLHDRHKNDTNSSSVGFIGFVVVPLYKLLGKAILEVENKHQVGLRTRIVDECLVVLNANKERYAKIVNGEEVDEAPVHVVEDVETPPGINGEHQSKVPSSSTTARAMLHLRKVSRPTSARAKVLTERTSGPAADAVAHRRDRDAERRVHPVFIEADPAAVARVARLLRRGGRARRGRGFVRLRRRASRWFCSVWSRCGARPRGGRRRFLF